MMPRFGSTIYTLKRHYGYNAVVLHVSDLEVDPFTGMSEKNTVTQNIGIAVILPSRVVAQTFAVFRTKEHPGSAFYSKHSTVGLIDRAYVLPTFKISIADTLIAGITSFKISEILDLHGEQFIEVGLEDLNSEGMK